MCLRQYRCACVYARLRIYLANTHTIYTYRFIHIFIVFLFVSYETWHTYERVMTHIDLGIGQVVRTYAWYLSARSVWQDSVIWDVTHAFWTWLMACVWYDSVLWDMAHVYETRNLPCADGWYLRARPVWYSLLPKRLSVMSHTALHCNALQPTAPRCNHSTKSDWSCRSSSNTEQHTATHINTLQHTATHCKR